MVDSLQRYGRSWDNFEFFLLFEQKMFKFIRTKVTGWFIWRLKKQASKKRKIEQSEREVNYSQTRLLRTTRDWPFLLVITGVRYNKVNLCTKMTNSTKKSVRYNRVLVNNRVCYNKDFCSLSLFQFRRFFPIQLS